MGGLKENPKIASIMKWNLDKKSSKDRYFLSLISFYKFSKLIIGISLASQLLNKFKKNCFSGNFIISRVG